MCGISAVIHYHKSDDCQCNLDFEKIEEPRLKLIKNRGPNSYAKHLSTFPNVDVQFYASVLHLRGTTNVIQPVTQNSGNVLLWNGEVFDGVPVSNEENDTAKLLSLLDKCKSEQEVLDVFSSIKGPWAFIFFFKPKMQLFFGRDIIGRRSLLWKELCISNSGCRLMIISSVGDSGTTWNNIPATGIFSLNLTSEKDNLFFYPWAQSISGIAERDLTFPFRVVRTCEIISPITKELDKSDPQNNTHFLEFEKVVNGVPGNNFELLYENISKHEFFQEKVKLFLDALGKAVKLRVNNQSWLCDKCSSSVCGHKTIGILFSGGLDCSVLAILSDKFLPPGIPVDLINVSFEHDVVLPAQKKSKKQLHQKTFDSPDRLSALNSYEELKKLSPDRTWNFVAVDVMKLELQDCRENRVHALILPHQTVLDDSIGCALWFASRGQGKLKSNELYTNYTSPAKIVLLGMGADEQLGGYSRHRNRFQKDGWEGLNDEIRIEIDRISERNLARDDRIISDSGREARFPYLDENVVNFLNELPVWIKAYLKLPRGMGEKLLLRAAAYSLGLRYAAVLPKRAIQFGSRIAHLETKSEKGSDVCARLQSVEV